MKTQIISFTAGLVLSALSATPTHSQCSIPKDASPPRQDNRFFTIDDLGQPNGLSSNQNSLIWLLDAASPLETHDAVSGWGLAAGPNETLFVWIDDPGLQSGIWNLRADGTGLQLVVPLTTILEKGMCSTPMS